MLKTFFRNCVGNLHYIYLLFALIMVCATAITTPPFQNPDEPNHFARAEQVARLEFTPVFVHDTLHAASRKTIAAANPRIQYPDQGGFAVDRGIMAANDLFSPVAQHPDKKVSPESYDLAEHIKWGSGMIYSNFGNTAIYPPVVYLMPALGIQIGKFLDLSVVTSLYIARVLNGLLSIALCFLALRWARRSKVLLFTVLLFPMTIAMFASVSQDAFLISCAFLLTAMIDHVEFGETKTYNKWQLCTLFVLGTVIGIAKPPYVLLTGVFLFLKLNKRSKLISIALPVLVLICWLVLNRAAFSIKFAPAELGVNTKLQMLHIIRHPFRFLGMFFVYDKQGLIDFSRMFVGVLGWLDLIFSRIYYRNAYIMLAVALIVSSGWVKPHHFRLRMASALCALLTLACVLTAQYITWTTLESTSLSGMQGRYALPIFPFLALALSGSEHPGKMVYIKTALLILVLIFPIYTGVTMFNGLNHRYY